MNTRILIAGGYGLVGGHVARHLRASGFKGDLILAGRNPDRGADLAKELNASVRQLDATNANSVREVSRRADVIIATTKDPRGILLEAAIDEGAAFIGITQSSDSVAPIIFRALHQSPRRPVVTLGHWQAGVALNVAHYLARHFASVESVRVAALYDRKDPVGPLAREDTGDYMSRALIRQDGVFKWVEARPAARTVERKGQDSFPAIPMGVLDVPSLAGITNARNIRFDIGVGDSRGTAAGDKASHEIYFELEGDLTDGSPGRLRAVLSDPNGQGHLTGLGILLAVEALANVSDGESAAQGWRLPETLIEPHKAIERLEQFGVMLSEETSSLTPALSFADATG